MIYQVDLNTSNACRGNIAYMCISMLPELEILSLS